MTKIKKLFQWMSDHVYVACIIVALVLLSLVCTFLGLLGVFRRNSDRPFASPGEIASQKESIQEKTEQAIDGLERKKEEILGRNPFRKRG